MLDCSRDCAFPTDMVGVVSNIVKLCKLLELEAMRISEQGQALSNMAYAMASLRIMGLVTLVLFRT